MADAELSPYERMAFLAMWAGELIEMLGPPEHGFTGEQVRAFVRTAEDNLANIWDQHPSPPVIARTVVYGLLDEMWKAARDG